MQGEALSTVEARKSSFSLERLSLIGDRNSDAEILQRVQSFYIKYEQMIEDIETAMQRIEKCSHYAETQVRVGMLLHYRRKIRSIQQSMKSIDSKVLAIQARLNAIRKNMPDGTHSLVESGPFFYRCIHPGGVRYRDYPSVNSKIVNLKAIVVYKQIVEIAERVYIAAEHSVFLHCRGVGWLFENKKDRVCFERIAPT